ncbi:TlpA family protein disulfide reductase [Aquimarina brevivitae]|uniref:Thioredoxin domain-containing protein n=1 Tax=Aquimarina brevivitae TaxID=323412 RepID=A0A4Q7P2E9_9FLAO|nr:hypothetical protein [Aquimarina brevivitae]RZS93518.1 hypothetical protein EV197_2098 [Aquimarina brevivitae]
MFKSPLKLLFLFITPLIFCFGCIGSNDTPKREYTYIGGEVVNPNADYIILFSERGIGDTVKLDTNNRFLYKTKDIENGVYSFKHNPENQLLLIEKGDSLLLRLNTFEFDESLVFTGDGAKKNNFLIESFLQNEEERNQLQQSGFRMDPQAFIKQQDSLYKIRLKEFKRLNKKIKLSEFSQKILKASFEYDYYARYELYHYRHYGITDLTEIKDLPSTFFDYRKQIDFNDTDLKRLYSYNRFLNHYFTNAAYVNHAKGKSFYQDPVGNTNYKLQLVDSVVTEPYIKNNMQRGITARFLLDSRNEEYSEEVLNYYLKVSSNEPSQKDMIKLANATNKLKPGSKVPNQALITSDGEEINLISLLNKPVTALYFWSLDDINHSIKAHKTALYYSKLYPQIDFIAVNINDEETKNWQGMIKRYNYNPLTEYEFKHPKCATEEFVIYNKEKVVLIDESGYIIDAHANLFSPIFETQLINTLRNYKNSKEKAATQLTAALP